MPIPNLQNHPARIDLSHYATTPVPTRIIFFSRPYSRADPLAPRGRQCIDPQPNGESIAEEKSAEEGFAGGTDARQSYRQLSGRDVTQ